MKIKELIAQRGEGISFEFFPPKTSADEDQLFGVMAKLESLNPVFVSVTCGAGGGVLKNTRHVVERITEETFLVPMPHLTCIGQSKEELQGTLRDYQRLGVENILALRGDPPRETTKNISKDQFCYAKDLMHLAASFGSFSIGVAVYPEGHPESPGLEMDMVYTKQKIEAGADFAITQMFFGNHFFYSFMERAEKVGISIPMIPGIMPITEIAKIKMFSEMCGATLPASLVERMEKATSKEEVRKMGIDFATRQCEDLLANGVRYLHFYTLNRAETVQEILHNLALDRVKSVVI